MSDRDKDAEILAVGPEYCVTSSDLGVFVEEAANPVSPDDFDVSIDGIG